MPGFFDYVAADRQAREDLERKQFATEIEQALKKVYGTEGDASIKTEPDKNSKSV